MYLRVLSLSFAGTYICEGLSSDGSIPLLQSSESKVMRDVMELLRAKEQELVKVKRQVEALRIAAPLLGGEDDKTMPSTGPMAVKGVSTLS
jgi:hypothetical protein